MTKLRKRLTYANVMSSIAVFLVLGGATAVAAKKIGSNELKSGSVTAAKLKKNAVTAAKLKKNAVTRAKIRNGAVNSSKIGDGSVTGADIDAASTPFSQVVAEVRGGSAPFVEGPYQFGNPTFTQNAGEDVQFNGALDVTFDAGCAAPRQAVALLLLDAPTPGIPSKSKDIIGLGLVEDLTGAQAAHRMEFSQFSGSFSPMSLFAPAAATPHTFSVLLAELDCTAGSGATVSGAGVDVIGTK